jgi:predicted DCC family thiol-disulfide oxidoreductase YuxK
MHDPAAAEILGNRLDTFLAEDTVGLLHRGKLYLKSTAACRALALIGFPYSLGALGLLVPPSIRNFIYNKIARNRHSSH